MYAFPSGIAELAERNELVLAEAATTAPASSRASGVRDLARTMRRRLRGRAWTSVGYATTGPERVVAINGRARPWSAQGRRLPTFVDGTFVYVVRRPAVEA